MKRLVQVGAVREPRARLLVDGKAVPGLLTATVTTNAHYQADTFEVSLALNAAGGQTLQFWGADELVGKLLDVRMSLDGDERSMILGEADKIAVHPGTGTIEISGRDLTARFIDNRIQEAFQNKTASEVVELLARRHGLTPVVTATTTPVSRFYGDTHDRVQHDQFSSAGTEWDLMQKLAQFEGFDLYVQGRELHFEPAVDPEKAEPYAVRWDQDARRSEVIRLRLDRSLTLARDVIVLVRSWGSGKGRSFTRTSPAGSGASKVQAGKAQRFSYTRPNLTEDQAQKLADSIRADITRHERNMSFSCPLELDLTSRDVLLLRGCGGWDQRYFVDTVTRRVGFEEGGAMDVAAKNHSVESAAASGGGQPLTEGQA